MPGNARRRGYPTGLALRGWLIVPGQGDLLPAVPGGLDAY